jgi:plastocyanin
LRPIDVVKVGGGKPKEVNMRNERGTIGKVAIAVAAVCVATAGAALAGMAAQAATKTTTVKVTETNYKILLSRHTVKPGPVKFVVVNHGTVAHEFAIHGPSVNKRIPGKLTPGSKKTLTVRLRKGTYKIDCPIHVALGMKATLHVGSKSGGTTTNSTTTSSWG